MTKTAPAPDGIALTIAGHKYRRLRVEGTKVGPTIARMLCEPGCGRIFLQAEGENVIREIPHGHAAAEDLANLERAGKVYVLIVEENGTRSS